MYIYIRIDEYKMQKFFYLNYKMMTMTFIIIHVIKLIYRFLNFESVAL
jgi:hypothetical protein